MALLSACGAPENQRVISVNFPDDGKNLYRLNRAITQEPNMIAHYHERAQILLRMEDYQQALKDISHAITHQKTSSAYWALRAEIKAQLLDYRGAAADITRALDVNDTPKNAYDYYIARPL